MFSTISHRTLLSLSLKCAWCHANIYLGREAEGQDREGEALLSARHGGGSVGVGAVGGMSHQGPGCGLSATLVWPHPSGKPCQHGPRSPHIACRLWRLPHPFGAGNPSAHLHPWLGKGLPSPLSLNPSLVACPSLGMHPSPRDPRFPSILVTLCHR